MMLILTRKAEEVIHIGDDITITVLKISYEQVRIGIEAPRNIPVYRREVLLRLNAEMNRGDLATIL